MKLKDHELDECPFCEEELIWRNSDKQWIHPGNGCVLVGIGLHNSGLVRLWNTRGGVPSAYVPAPAGGPHNAPTLSELLPPPPPPPPPACKRTAIESKHWVDMEFTVNGGSEVFKLIGMVDFNETRKNINE